MAEESFNQAFARARREGKETFMWKGKTYGTKLKGENDSSNRGGAKQAFSRQLPICLASLTGSHCHPTWELYVYKYA